MTSTAAREAARDLYYKTGALVIPPGDHDFIEVASRALDAFAAARVAEERRRAAGNAEEVVAALRTLDGAQP